MVLGALGYARVELLDAWCTVSIVSHCVLKHKHIGLLCAENRIDAREADRIFVFIPDFLDPPIDCSKSTFKKHECEPAFLQTNGEDQMMRLCGDHERIARFLCSARSIASSSSSIFDLVFRVGSP